jgi:U32 family peptidase
MKSDQTNPVAVQTRTSAGKEPFRAPHSAARIPELLAPAGDWECAKAAVENGADAIYFGLEKFNARMRAHNFTEADLPRLMGFLHRRGVKGYVTFNTLVFENELAQAEQYLRTMIAAGVDAAIVQDVGICRLIRQLSPDFPIHVSTQMTVTSAGGVEFARELGCNLVVLARECSLKEIEKIVNSDKCRVSSDECGELEKGPLPSPPDTRRPTLPIEVFVHGALCVAYSGQCLTSEALGGRSANRGECAQACRLPYDLIADGKQVPLGDRKYLLSPQDLAGLEVLPELVRVGVTSLKIEGRLKTPEYVANITRIYRQALDSLAEGRESRVDSRRMSDSSRFRPSTLDTGLAQYEMEMAFSRGLYTGWFKGNNNQKLVHARFGKKRGVYLGEISQIEGERVMLKLQAPIKPGDGVVFDAGHPEQEEEGGRVYGIRTPKSEIRNAQATVLAFGRGDIDFSRVHVGDKLWKTSDPELARRLRQTFEGEQPHFHRPLHMAVHGRAGEPMTLIARDEQGHVVRLDSSMPLAQAAKRPLTAERLRQQLGRLGGTSFQLAELESCLEGQVLLPVSELNRLRREAVSELEALRGEPKRWRMECGAGKSEVRSQRSEVGEEQSRLTPAATKAELIVLARNLPQLEAALNCGIETLYCEFEDPKKYRNAVSHFRNSAFRTPHSALFVAPPRIFKMGEEWILKQVRSCDADGYLVRNYDHLSFFANDRCVGDFSLNIANRLSADYFKNKFGLERVTASYDLNFTQLEALLQGAPPEWFEVTIHQHMPMFHMEHCVFCAFLSSGTDYTNCGRPCDKHDLKLRDRVGAQHPVKADLGCRNTVFNALAQTGADYAARMLALGARHFRLEFLNESPEQVTQTISKYRQLLRGEITGPQLWRELKLLNQLGVTRGQIGGGASG